MGQKPGCCNHPKTQKGLACSHCHYMKMRYGNSFNFVCTGGVYVLSCGHVLCGMALAEYGTSGGPMCPLCVSRERMMAIIM